VIRLKSGILYLEELFEVLLGVGSVILANADRGVGMLQIQKTHALRSPHEETVSLIRLVMSSKPGRRAAT
jgi:hypothetical protein